MNNIDYLFIILALFLNLRWYFMKYNFNKSLKVYMTLMKYRDSKDKKIIKFCNKLKKYKI